MGDLLDRRVGYSLGILAGIFLVFYLAVYLHVTFVEGFGNPHLFIDPDNLANLLGQAAIVGILAAGMTLVIVSGQIDLSVGSMLGMCGAVAALMLSREGLGWPAGLAVGCTITLGALLGALHGFIIARFGVPAFIVTLGGLMVYRGVLLLLASRTIPIDSVSVNWLGAGALPDWASFAVWGVLTLIVSLSLFRRPAMCTPRMIIGMVLSAGALGGVIWWLTSGTGIPVRFMLAVCLAGVVAILATRYRFGRYLYAIGGNSQAAYYSGINITAQLTGVFALMGAVAALAGIVSSGIQMAAEAGAGDLMELYAIAACVIGGASLSGGRGSVLASLVGALIMATIRNGLSCLGVGNPGEKIVLGVILVTAVALDLRLSRSSNTPIQVV